jgi:hypothetical protein
LSFAFSKLQKKNSCRFLFLRENCRSSSYQRSFFLFAEDFWLCEHETYNFISISCAILNQVSSIQLSSKIRIRPLQICT